VLEYALVPENRQTFLEKMHRMAASATPKVFDSTTPTPSGV
jgi:hypothetical protein